jgi:hypothetical protein
MCDKELTKKLLKGPLCFNCVKRGLSWEADKESPSQFCSQFQKEPTYDIQCTCEHFVKMDPNSITAKMFAIVRKVYPSVIAGEIIEAGEIEKRMAEQKRKDKETP